VGETVEPRDAGVREQQPDGTERLVRGVLHRPHLVTLAHVTREADGGPAVLVDDLGNLVGPLLHDVGDDDRRSLVGEGKDDAETYAAAAPRDQCDLAGDLRHCALPSTWVLR